MQLIVNIGLTVAHTVVLYQEGPLLTHMRSDSCDCRNTSGQERKQEEWVDRFVKFTD